MFIQVVQLFRRAAMGTSFTNAHQAAAQTSYVYGHNLLSKRLPSLLYNKIMRKHLLNPKLEVI